MWQLSLKMIIIGREKEKEILTKIIKSKDAEFLVVLGRRRVGKTYLIQHCCSDADYYFECTGMKDGKLSFQLSHFIKQFSSLFYQGINLEKPKNWQDAFDLLTKQIKQIPIDKTIVLFFDELPWLASKRSGFLSVLDHYWNTVWKNMTNLKLIVCGSAASWLLNNIINAKGGLHNRITRSMLLEPFTLSETNEFLKHKGFLLSKKQVLDVYMVMGGIPYYLNQLSKTESISQNIDNICFKKDGLLFSEFSRIFKSLFEKYDVYIKIIRCIAEKRYGIAFNDLTKIMQKKAGGRLLERLQELEVTGFIQKRPVFGKKREHIYTIVDEYCLFYLKWIDKKMPIIKGQDIFSKIKKSPSFLSWSGYSFEGICYKHVDKIIDKLQIKNVVNSVLNWNIKTEDDGAQIDLIFDRDDDAINICEIKQTEDPFVINKDVAKNILKKIDLFKDSTKTKKQIFINIIASNGIKENAWSEELISQTVTLDDLF